MNQVLVRELQAGEEALWDAYVTRSPQANIYAWTGWKRVMEDTYGHVARYRLAESGGDVRGILPLLVVRSRNPLCRLVGTYVTSLPGGVCADDEGAAQRLVADAKRLAQDVGADYLVLRDGRRRLVLGGDFVTSERHCTLVLKLPASAERLWHDLPSAVRNRVRKAEKSGLSVSSGGEELVTDFYTVFARNMRDLGTPVFGEDFIRRVVAEFPTRTRIFLVWDGHIPVGGMLVLVHRDCVYNPWVSSVREFFPQCPNDLLYWMALLWACERGFDWFDFGRSQWESGTYRFKAKWGADPVPLYYQYYLRNGDEIPDASLRVEDDVIYRLARWVWQRLPVPVARVAGPPIVSYLNPIG